ncbi:MAG: hypothetical protein CSA81_04200 [Acidobacteria bacterium]|nr:MAG: hypothetical protein CSA81_04200 [Acidobacteriota bacterium]
MRFILVIALCWGSLLHGECTLSNENLDMISNRYETVSVSESLLFLSRGDLLIVRDLNDTQNLQILNTVKVPGTIVQLAVVNQSLLAALKGEGVMEYRILDEKPWIAESSFLPIEGLSRFSVDSGFMAVAANSSLELYLEEDLEWSHLSSWPFDDRIKQLHVAGNRINLLLFNGSLFTSRIDSSTDQAFQFNRIQTDQFSVFYNFSHAVSSRGDKLLLDSQEGILLVNLTEEEHIYDTVFLLKNEGAKVVLNMSADEGQLFLRFPDTIEWYEIGENQLTYQDGLNLPVSEYGIPALHMYKQTLFLINTNDLPGSWSLLGFDMSQNKLLNQYQIQSSVNQVKGFLFENNQLFLAVDNTLFSYPWSEDSAVEPESLQIVKQFPTSILSMVSTPSGFVLSTNNLELQGTELVFFSALGGEALQTQNFFYERGVQNLISSGSLLAFYDSEQTDEGTILNLHLFKYDNGIWAEKIYMESFKNTEGESFSGMLPFNDFVVFYENKTLYSIDYEHLIKKPVFTAPSPILAVGHVDGTVLIETKDGMTHIDPNSPKPLGEYPFWYDLSVTQNSVTMVRSKNIPEPGQYEILDLDEQKFLYPAVRLKTGVPPTHLVIKNLKLFMHTPYSLQEFDFECPGLPNEYIWPSFENLEIDLNTNTGQNEIIRWNFWNAENQLIGRYFLDSNLIHRFNGRPLKDWPLAFNDLSELHRVTVKASFPLLPILSGNLTGQDRFAIPFPGRLYQEASLPHVASSDKGWENNLFLQFHPFGGSSEFHINWGGQEIIDLPIPDSAYGVYEIPQGLNQSVSPPWLAIEASGLNAGFTGFNVFSQNQNTAGILLENDPSDIFPIPVINDNELLDWQGIAISNPDPELMYYRIFGYDQDGVIVLDKSGYIDEFSKLVMSVDDLLVAPNADEEVQWLSVITERKTTAISVFGTKNSQAIASFSLKPEYGNTLILPGVKHGSIQTHVLLVNRSSIPGTGVAEAYSKTGVFLGQKELSFTPKETKLLQIAELFNNLSDYEIAQISTVTIEVTNDSIGVCFRYNSDNGHLEAYRLFTQN